MESIVDASQWVQSYPEAADNDNSELSLLAHFLTEEEMTYAQYTQTEIRVNRCRFVQEYQKYLQTKCVTDGQVGEVECRAIAELVTPAKLESNLRTFGLLSAAYDEPDNFVIETKALIDKFDDQQQASAEAAVQPLVCINTVFPDHNRSWAGQLLLAEQRFDLAHLEELKHTDTKWLRVYYKIYTEITEREFTIGADSLDVELSIQDIMVTYARDTNVLAPAEIKGQNVTRASPLKLCIEALPNKEMESIFIVFSRRNGEAVDKLYVEQYVFSRMLIPKTAPLFLHLELKETLHTYPPDETKVDMLLMFYRSQNPVHLYGEMADYIKKGKTLTARNIYEVLYCLLQLQDSYIVSAYKKLKLDKTQIETVDDSADLYAVKFDRADWCQPLYDDDLIILSDNRVLHKHRKLYYARFETLEAYYEDTDFALGTVRHVKGNRVEFTCQTKLYAATSYKIIFRPNRHNLRLQYRALRSAVKVSYKLDRILFPNEQTIEASVETPEPQDRADCAEPLVLENAAIATNPEQLAAVTNIVKQKRLPAPFMIFGPPGTGKTTTIVEVIWQLVSSSNGCNKVLAVSHSNAACDEIALRLMRLSQKHQREKLFVRVYDKSQEPLKNSLNEDLLEYSNLYSNHFYPAKSELCKFSVIICTLSVAGTLSLGDFNIDQYSHPLITHLFIDDVGAATESEALVGIMSTLSTKLNVILSGDYKQLGPYVRSRIANKLGSSKSLLERLLQRDCYAVADNGVYDQRIQSRLRRNYRSHSSIVRLFSTLFYDNEIMAMAPAEKCNLAKNWPYLKNQNFPIIFVPDYGQTDTTTRSYCNPDEISTVMGCVKQLMFIGINGRRVKESEIGIITPYNRQYTILRRELARRNWRKIECGPVELAQGDEKEIIIASFVHSNVPHVTFAEDKKRLNVLLSRAKSLLILIGNPNTLSQDPDMQFIINACISTKIEAPVKEVPAEENLSVREAPEGLLEDNQHAESPLANQLEDAQSMPGKNTTVENLLTETEAEDSQLETQQSTEDCSDFLKENLIGGSSPKVDLEDTLLEVSLDEANSILDDFLKERNVDENDFEDLKIDESLLEYSSLEKKSDETAKGACAEACATARLTNATILDKNLMEKKSIEEKEPVPIRKKLPEKMETVVECEVNAYEENRLREEKKDASEQVLKEEQLEKRVAEVESEVIVCDKNSARKEKLSMEEKKTASEQVHEEKQLDEMKTVDECKLKVYEKDTAREEKLSLEENKSAEPEITQKLKIRRKYKKKAIEQPNLSTIPAKRKTGSMYRRLRNAQSLVEKEAAVESPLEEKSSTQKTLLNDKPLEERSIGEIPIKENSTEEGNVVVPDPSQRQSPVAINRTNRAIRLPAKRSRSIPPKSSILAKQSPKEHSTKRAKEILAKKAAFEAKEKNEIAVLVEGKQTPNEGVKRGRKRKVVDASFKEKGSEPVKEEHPEKSEAVVECDVKVPEKKTKREEKLPLEKKKFAEPEISKKRKISRKNTKKVTEEPLIEDHSTKKHSTKRAKKDLLAKDAAADAKEGTKKEQDTKAEASVKSKQQPTEGVKRGRPKKNVVGEPPVKKSIPGNIKTKRGGKN